MSPWWIQTNQILSLTSDQVRHYLFWKITHLKIKIKTFNLSFFNGFVLNFSGTSILNNLKLELDMDSNLSPNLGNNGMHIFKTVYRRIKNSHIFFLIFQAREITFKQVRLRMLFLSCLTSQLQHMMIQFPMIS